MWVWSLSFRQYVAFCPPIPNPAAPDSWQLGGASHVLAAGQLFVYKLMSKLIISPAYGDDANARFGGHELAVYAGRSAAAGARLCRQAGGALWHHPRAMGGAGQGRAHRGAEAVGTRRTDGNAADHADAADRSAVRQWLDRAPRRRDRPPRQPALSAQGGAPLAGQTRRAALGTDGNRARRHQSGGRPPPPHSTGSDQGKRAQRHSEPPRRTPSAG